jgi:TRAP-type C4-dicarboxylate transport system permease small subunit
VLGVDTGTGLPHSRLRLWARRLAVCGVVVLVLQACSIVVDAFSRWLFNTPVPGMEDVNGVIIAVTISSFMPVLFMDRANVAVTLLGRALGPRPSSWLDAFGHVCAFGFIVLLAWQYLDYAIDLQETHTLILRLPRRPMALLAGLLLVITAALQLLVMITTVKTAIEGRSLDPTPKERA